MTVINSKDAHTNSKDAQATLVGVTAKSYDFARNKVSFGAPFALARYLGGQLISPGTSNMIA